MENNLPLVTVNILSFNRRDELRYTLQKVYEQDYKNIEVIVVDNASTDGTREMVKSEFPDVILIELEKNIGIAGWNEGFKIAKGEYVLVLDDDAYPKKDAIFLSIIEFEKDDSIACITLNLLDVNTMEYYIGHWLPKDKKHRTEWPIFAGCGFIVARERLPKEFQFPLGYFIYQHELPMASEIFIAKKKIIFVPEIIGYHNFKHSFSYNKLNDLMNFQNTLKFIIDYIPTSIFLFYYFQIIIFYFTRSIKYNWLKDYILVVIKTKPVSFKTKISYEYFFRLRRIRVFNYSILSKIKNL